MNTHAGMVAPSNQKYTVVCAHAHKTLKEGDEVLMVVTPSYSNLLLRLSDMTLHDLEGGCDQYVHLEETKEEATPHETN